jgi:hypothetical protein
MQIAACLARRHAELEFGLYFENAPNVVSNVGRIGAQPVRARRDPMGVIRLPDGGLTASMPYAGKPA